MSRFLLPVLLTSSLAACGLPPSQDFDAQRLSAAEAEVRALVASIPADLAGRGPVAWLDHFDPGPDFFMASDGIALFPDFATADSVVRGFAPSIAALSLTWDDVRIDVLSPDGAVFATPYHETLTDTAGTVTAFGGFVTATVVRHAAAWKIRHLHWSSPVTP